MAKKRRATTILLLVLGLLCLGAGAAWLFRDRLESWFFRPTNSSVQQGITRDDTVEVMAQDLTVPWEIAFLPNDELLVSERSGTLKQIAGNTTHSLQIEGVRQTSEGGLLGLALHPHFAQNRWLYVYYTTDGDGGLANKVERYRFADNRLSDRTEVIGNIPAASNHDGGRIAFGPDGLLYIATGDAGNPESAQDTKSLAGKILRVQDDGTPAADNPFGNAVYSYGHRNVQGLAWDANGQLWATEHGPSGMQSGHDELNRIIKGANYGWPLITGDQTRAGMQTPVLQSGADDTWAPAGMAYYGGSLFFAGLRGQTLYQAQLQEDGSATLTAHFRQTYGRLRAVAVHDGYLYFGTSNTDGRGSPKRNDDTIMRIRLTAFD